MARAILSDGTAGFPGTAPLPDPRLRQAPVGSGLATDSADLHIGGGGRCAGAASNTRPLVTSRAFTAIELMVVIAIILLLVGMLVPTISGIRGRARKQTAATRLKGISIALERHFLDRGFYPPDTGTFGGFLDSYSQPIFGSMQLSNDLCQDNDALASQRYKDDPYSLYRYLCGPEGQGVYDAATSRTYGPYIQFEENELRDESASTGDAWSKIALDPWGRPWVYEEHRSIGKLTAARRLADYPDWRAHNRDRYDIYSVGPDGVIDNAPAGQGCHNARDDDSDERVDEADEARYDGRDNDGDGTVDDPGEVGDDVTNW